VWHQWVQAGVEVRSLAAFQRAFVDELRASDGAPVSDRAATSIPQFRYPELARRWSVLGDVRMFRLPGHGDGSVTPAFLACLDLPPVRGLTERGTRVNERPDDGVIVALLAVNRRNEGRAPADFADDRYAAKIGSLGARRGSADLAPDPGAEIELRTLFAEDAAIVG